MGQVLFANFLEDKRVYHLARMHWERLFAKLTEDLGLSWRAYLNTADDFDGNPIFHAYLPEINRAVRIIQADPTEAADEEDISFWLDNTWVSEHHQDVPELVLDMVHSRSAEQKGKALLTAWLASGGTQEHEVEKTLESILSN
ncbi:MAG: hypothetical protein KDC54_10875 [Lewinella sp.]|nr:hypothetical protein [Lewinella sp.]